jgi:transcriptional regulator with XRE-family HTH domain
MDIRKRFGNRVSAQRHRLLLTQAELATAIRMSVDMISRIETGATGVRFPTIEKLADALHVDPSFFFALDPESEGDSRPELIDLMARLSKLDEADLAWVAGLLAAAFASRKKPGGPA